MIKARLITGETVEFYVIEGKENASAVAIELARLILNLESDAAEDGLPTPMFSNTSLYYDPENGGYNMEVYVKRA